MSIELKKRILTSIIIFPILLTVLVLAEVYLIIFLIFFFFISSYEINKNSEGLYFKIIAHIIIVISFFALFYLRGDNLVSLTLLSWGILSTILSDIGGYTFGKIFKGKKLTRISPNKTYSGSFGSIVLSFLSIPILLLLQKILIFNEVVINFFELKFIILTFIISLIAQIGDIFISFWKRKFNIKDTGNIFPGHGGILDRIDGLIFVLIFMFTLKLSNII